MLGGGVMSATQEPLREILTSQTGFSTDLLSLFLQFVAPPHRYVKHFEELVASGTAKEEAYSRSFAHYETLLRMRRELDRTALQEAQHFGATLEFGSIDSE